MAESVNFKICFNWLLDKWGGFAGDKDMAHRSGTKSYSKLDYTKLIPSKAEKPCREILTNWRAQKNTKLYQGMFRLYTRKRFFMQRVVGHQNTLPREVVTVLSLTELKKCLYNTLRHMV